jgi:predicted cobalt transporter CbtA
MRRLVIMAATIAGLCNSAVQAFAMGGGWTPPSASPYAILEPQTVNPDYATPAPAAAVATIGENAGDCGEGQACKRGHHRTRHRRQHP